MPSHLSLDFIPHTVTLKYPFFLQNLGVDGIENANTFHTRGRGCEEM